MRGETQVFSHRVAGTLTPGGPAAGADFPIADFSRRTRLTRPNRSLAAGQRLQAAAALFVLAAAATLTISSRDPWCSGVYSLCIFAFAIVVLLRRHRIAWRLAVSQFLAAAIAIWGWLQYAFSWSVYRHATLVASLHWTAGFATMLTAANIFPGRSLQKEIFLRAFAWLGFGLSVAGVLTNLTSRDSILWIFPSPYPDTWGPFLSRNDFAMFLELSLPVAFWGAVEISSPAASRLIAFFQKPIPLWVPACMLAAGLASASRAGAALLALETVFCLLLLKTNCPKTIVGYTSGQETEPRSAKSLLRSAGSRRLRSQGSPRSSVTGLLHLDRLSVHSWLTGPTARFLIFTAVAASVAGFSPLRERLREHDPFQFRREIAASTLAMIHARPVVGFGLGTFPNVYPAYATFDAGAVVEHAHNDWLEWSAEGGIPFALLWGMLAVALAFPAIRSRWGVGLLAIFLHGLVDYPFAKLGLTAWIFALAGMLQAEGERTPSPNALTKETREKR